MMALLIKGLLSAVLVIVKILCCLLLLLLLVILLVVFIPLRYQGRLSKEREKSLKEISLAGDIRWLCGVLRVSAAYNGREGAFSLYVMGIPADKLFKRKNRRHAGRPDKRSRMKETGQTAPESRKTERHAGEDEKDKKDKKDKKYKKYSGSRGRTSARTGRVKSGHGSASKRPSGHPPRRKNIRAGRTGVNQKRLRLLLSRDFWQNGGCLFVKHLLRLARMDNAKQEYVFEEFNLSTAIEATALPFESQAFEKQKNLEIDIQPDVTYTGSEQHIRQLAAIFIDNAMKYSNEHGTIKISLMRRGDNRILEFYNTGCEISQEETDKIFQRFYRGDKARNNKGKNGYGLGLAIAKSIMEIHKIKIQVTCEQGAWIRFLMIL